MRFRDEPRRLVTDSNDENKGGSSVRRLIDACRYSYAGFRHGIQHEAAIREELALLVILTPVSAFLHVSVMEHLLLVLSMLLVVLVEFMNSAIESTIDRISTDRHPLAGRAKDLGSAAVLISLAMWALTWGVIVGPLLVHSVWPR
jgi:diacylglycerol kinase (ATP)